MTCEEARQYLPGYIDNELELSLAMQIDAHLQECPDCKSVMESVKLVRKAAASPTLYFPASGAFRDQISKSLRIVQDHDQSRVYHSKPWFLYSLMAAAALLLISCSIWIYTASRPPHLQVAALLDSHLRSLQMTHLMDVESTDQHTVKPWFAGKLDFSPPVIDLSVEGFPLVGGRIDYLNEQKVAAIVYRRNKHVINLYITRGETTSAAESKDGFNLIQFEYDGMTCWAVSDVSTADLQQFVHLFRIHKPASTRW